MNYGMVINTKRCVGCDSCTVACKQSNSTGPGVFWSHVIKTETGTYPNARQEFLPVLCNHCENPTCVDVCPVGATYKKDDGTVVVDSDRCIGCRYCIIACPYEVRNLVKDSDESYFPEKGQTAYEKAHDDEHESGTCEKCDFCADRVAQGKDPACVSACPSKARTFGDLDDPKSEVSKLVRTKNATVLNPEVGTKPHVYYVG